MKLTVHLCMKSTATRMTSDDDDEMTDAGEEVVEAQTVEAR